jgi:putative transposase
LRHRSLEVTAAQPELECLLREICALYKKRTSFLDHYHEERNNQGLDNQLIDPALDVGHGDGKIRCRERLGGILRYYFRQAA